MSVLFPDFFETNNYFIDEKVGFFKFSNAYKVFDEHGEQIGTIQQQVPGWHKVLRMVLNKAMLPFSLEIKDMGDNVLVHIRRGWTFWMSKIILSDARGMPLGSIVQKFKLFKPVFRIFDVHEMQVAEITGDWKGWNFTIKDANQVQVGVITKKWSGILKEAFTTADKYIVSIQEEVAEDTRKMIMVSTAITIDMVLKESK